MAVDFTNSPTNGDTVTADGRTYTFNSTKGVWEVTAVSGSNLTDIVGDITPQLGGDLDVNGQSIISASNGNIPITPNGTGKIVLDGLSWPTADGTADYILKTDGVGNLSWSAPVTDLTDLGITDGTAAQVLTTNGAGAFTFADASGGGGSSGIDDQATSVAITINSDGTDILHGTTSVPAHAITQATGSGNQSIASSSIDGATFVTQRDSTAVSTYDYIGGFVSRHKDTGANNFLSGMYTIARDANGNMNLNFGTSLQTGYPDMILDTNGWLHVTAGSAYRVPASYGFSNTGYESGSGSTSGKIYNSSAGGSVYYAVRDDTTVTTDEFCGGYYMANRDGSAGHACGMYAVATGSSGAMNVHLTAGNDQLRQDAPHVTIANGGVIYFNREGSTANTVRGHRFDNFGQMYSYCYTGGNALRVYNYSGGSIVGSISVNASSVAYNTTSDYRVKENVVPLTGATERLKQLNPSRFNFIADAATTIDGFLAHEVSSVVPEAITGTYNGVETWQEGDELPDGVSVGDTKLDEYGNTIPEYQGIDQSKLVPLLVATIQELEARIAQLENA